jgi:IclR family pca regulon transcriptional regulator
MSRSTTHRYVITLVALGFLEQLPSRKYRLSLRVTNLGMAAMSSTGLKEHAHPYLLELRRQSRYTVSLGVLEGADLLYLDRVPSFLPQQRQIDLNRQTGSKVPAYCTAIGKLLIASLPTAECNEWVASIKLTRQGPNAISTKKGLLEELEQVQGKALAVSDEELAQQLLEIAAPVRNEAGEVVAAVALEAPASVIAVEELVTALSPHLVTTADRISARLGFRREDERPRQQRQAA